MESGVTVYPLVLELFAIIRSTKLRNKMYRFHSVCQRTWLLEQIKSEFQQEFAAQIRIQYSKDVHRLEFRFHFLKPLGNVSINQPPSDEPNFLQERSFICLWCYDLSHHVICFNIFLRLAMLQLWHDPLTGKWLAVCFMIDYNANICHSCQYRIKKVFCCKSVLSYIFYNYLIVDWPTTPNSYLIIRQIIWIISPKTHYLGPKWRIGPRWGDW